MNGFSRCSILAGRVRIITSLWRTGDDRTLPFLPHSMDKVERGETVWKLRIGSITRSYESTEQGKRHHFGRFALPKNARLHTSSDFPDSLFRSTCNGVGPEEMLRDG